MIDNNFSILKVNQLSKSFGGIQALNGVSLSIEKGTITSLIGPNGAGKTTFINVITGIYQPSAGEIFYQEHNITGFPAHVLASLGLSRTFQFVEPFETLTVLQNVMVGYHTKCKANILSVGLKLPAARVEEKRNIDNARETLKMVGLEHRATDLITSLPLGERKLVGIARVLNMKPKLLMLDEPVGGLAAHEINKVVKLIHSLVERGVTVLIVEHNMPFVMSISERVIVLDRGCIIADGPPESIKSNETVIKAYLGEEA